LKSATTEWGHVADWLALAALALSEVHFDVKSDDRPSLSWPAARSLGDRVAAVLSERVARTLVPAERSEGSLHVRGFVSRADQHRATAGALHFFVNGRPVRDRLLRHALLESYRDVLPRGRFPTAVLFVELPPGEVDVNVHPAKWEVRFADPMAMHRLVRAALRDALAGAPRAPGAVSYARPAPRLQVRETTGPTDWVWAAPAGEPAQLDLGTSDTPGPRSAPLRFSELRCVGQVLGTYLALEAPDGLVLVDQHAAHERVLFERLRAQRLEGAIERQALLFPLTLELDPAGGAALLSRADEAAALGFEIEPFGGSATRVRAVPALLAERDPGALVRHLAETLAEAEATGAETSAGAALSGAESAIASLACHAARRAGDILDPREQRALLDALDAIPWRPTCPHGRPVALTLGVAEIERRFGRDYRF
jgi:DNA mismatch repair protein MutL